MSGLLPEDCNRKIASMEEAIQRMRALEATMMLLLRVNGDLERSVQALVNLIHKGLGQLEELRKINERPHPAGAALATLLSTMAADPKVRLIVACVLALVALSLLSVHPGSPLYPLFALAERYLDRSAHAD